MGSNISRNTHVNNSFYIHSIALSDKSFTLPVIEQTPTASGIEAHCTSTTEFDMSLSLNLPSEDVQDDAENRHEG